MISDKEMTEICQVKRTERIIMYGGGVSLVIALAVRYVGSDIDLRALLLLNKETHKFLEKAVYK